MNKTQAGRLLTLAYFLKTEVNRSAFNMSSFFAIDGNDWCVRNLAPHPLDNPPCGTTACALGWATHVFPLDYKMTQDGVPVPVDGSEHTEFDYQFFGIDDDGWEELFSARHKRTPKQEAKVIEKFVLDHGWTYA